MHTSEACDYRLPLEKTKSDKVQQGFGAQIDLANPGKLQYTIHRMGKTMAAFIYQPELQHWMQVTFVCFAYSQDH